MTRFIIPLTALFALSAPAHAGDVEITLKVSNGSFATALFDEDPGAGWVAVNADPETNAAKAKADILIESLEELGGPVMGIRYDARLLDGVAWGQSDDRMVAIFAVDTVDIERGSEDHPGEVLDCPESATIAAPVGLTWTDVSREHTGYLLVDGTTGEATAVLPATTLGLTGIEPDEID